MSKCADTVYFFINVFLVPFYAFDFVFVSFSSMPSISLIPVVNSMNVFEGFSKYHPFSLLGSELRDKTKRGRVGEGEKSYL